MRKMFTLLCLFALVSPVQAEPNFKGKSWDDLVTAVLQKGEVKDIPGSDSLVAVALESGTPPSVERIVLLGRTDPKAPDTLHLLGVGVSLEVWERTGRRTSAWTVDQWIFSADVSGTLARVGHQVIDLTSEGKILKTRSVLGHLEDDILPKEQALFDKLINGWFLRLFKLK